MQTEYEQLEIQAELERVIGRMQKIQRAVNVSRQPVSMLELMELKDLGVEYARLVDTLANTRSGPGLA